MNFSSQITTPYKSRPNEFSLIGSAGTHNYPVARWVEKKRRRILLAETFQNRNRLPVNYGDVVQQRYPWGLFDTQSYWAERGSAQRGLRLPRGGNVPVVIGVSGGNGIVPFDYDVDLRRNLESRREISSGPNDKNN